MVKFVRNLETIFTKYIEDFFDKKFTSGLQPVEIAKKLTRLMENERSVGVSHIYVPNNYTVYVSQEDYTRLEPYISNICQELTTYLLEKAKAKKYVAEELRVSLVMNENVKPGKFQVDCQFSILKNSNDIRPDELKKDDEMANTKIYAKAIIPESKQPEAIISALLTVIEGLDTGLRADITTNRVNIGRREGNELPLADLNTSRLHAYIIYEDGGHMIYDAKSLNGTYVNNHRITRKKLQSGDRIKLGNTVILYEVK